MEMALNRNLNSDVNALPAKVRTDVARAQARLRKFMKLGLVKDEEIVGRTVLDWECGDGSFAAALLLHGAKEVVGIDTWLNADQVAKTYVGLSPAIKFHRTSIFDYSGKSKFDAAFTCNVTEHVPQIERQVEALSAWLEPDAPFIVSHHNYLHAIGHHDFMFLETSPNGIRVRAPACWDAEEKCEASDSFRRSEAKARAWMWNHYLDKLRNPRNCNACPYFRRARPWAHLVNSDHFIDMYPRNFWSGKDGSTLNKVTTFQLRQALVEAGFNIDLDQRDLSSTPPPPDLVSRGFFTEIDLRTFMYRLRCVKRSEETRTAFSL